jgi:hypothetical protein
MERGIKIDGILGKQRYLSLSWLFLSHKEKVMKISMRLVLGSLLIISGISGCGKKTSKKDTPAVENTGQLMLNFEASNANQTSFALGQGLQNAGQFLVGAEPESIASGAPDSFEVSVLSMDLAGKDAAGSEISTNIFKSEAGQAIKIEGSNVDLSKLFTSYACYKADGSPITLGAGETCKCGVDATGAVIAPQADGSCKLTDANGNLQDITEPSGILKVASATYATLSVTFAPKAKIKGCVTGNFRTNAQTTANGSAGTHTYCTKTALATTNESITPSAADFESSGAEDIEIYLGKSWDQRANNLQVYFPIKDGLKISSDSNKTLSLVIDVNRMLRFYNKGRPDSGPNPSFPVNRAYFFTTIFEESLFVFAGKPGSIKGYSFLTSTCMEATVTSDYLCATSTAKSVAGWMTLILDADGNPFAASAMPDDDNNLTTIKGGNRKANVGIDSSMITKNSDSSYSVALDLSGDTPTIKNVDLTKAKGETFESSYDGIKNGSNLTFGKVTFTRGL